MKRYEHWVLENGKPIKKFTQWFKVMNDELQPKYQIGRSLRNEYRYERD